MATTEELFISVEPNLYRSAKASVLISQADLLQALKHVQNLKVLSRQKNDLKIKLQKLSSSLISSIDSLQKKVPDPKVPKTISKKESYSSKTESIQRKVSSKKDEIEEELMAIRAKLEELNSQY